MQHNLLLLNTHEFGINPAFGNNRQQGKARALTHKIATTHPRVGTLGLSVRHNKPGRGREFTTCPGRSARASLHADAG